MLLNLVIFLRVALRYVYKTVARRREAPVHRRPRWYQAQEQGTPSNILVRAPSQLRVPDRLLLSLRIHPCAMLSNLELPSRARIKY